MLIRFAAQKRDKAKVYKCKNLLVKIVQFTIADNTAPSYKAPYFLNKY